MIGDLDHTRNVRILSRLGFLHQDLHAIINLVEDASCDWNMTSFGMQEEVALEETLQSIATYLDALVDDVSGMRALLATSMNDVADDYQPEIKVVANGSWLGPE